MENLKITDELPLWSAPFGLTLLDTVRSRKGIKALDIGSGSGFPLLELAERLGTTCSVYGIEISEQYTAQIRQKLISFDISNVEIINGDAEQLPFENDYFDLVISNNGLNNVGNEELALAECHRVSKPGAQLVVTFNLPHTMTEFYDAFELVLKAHGMAEETERMHEHIFEKRKPVEFYVDLLKKTGFGIRTINVDGFKYRFNDASAFMSHHFIRHAFLPHWKEIVPQGAREEISGRSRK